MAAGAASLVLADILDRFPPHELLDALCILEPPYWLSELKTKPGQPHSAASMNVLLRTLRQQYCKDKPIGEGTDTVAAVIDDGELISQFPAFKVIMRLMVPTVSARHQAAIAACNADVAADKAAGWERTGKKKYDGTSVATMLWATINDNSSYRQQISAWIRMAKISRVSVGGGVQVEQLFSYLTFIKNDLRSCLQPDHLNVCLRTYHTAHKYTLKGFPYMRAFVKWHGERKRRAADRTAADI